MSNFEITKLTMIFFELTKLTMSVFELTKLIMPFLCKISKVWHFSDKYRISEAKYAFLS